MAKFNDPKNPHMVICCTLDPYADQHTLTVPVGFRAFSVLFHDDYLRLYLRGPSKEIRTRQLEVFVVGTDEEIPQNAFHSVGSVMMPVRAHGSWPHLAFHVFTE